MSILNDKLNIVYKYAVCEAVRKMTRNEMIDSLVEELKQPTILQKSCDDISPVALLIDALKGGLTR